MLSQAEKQVNLTFDLWPEYLKFVAAENRKIKRRNGKAWAETKEYGDDYTKRMEKANAEADRINERNRRKFEEAQRAWDAQPWHKKLLGGDRPWLGPSVAPKHSTICWGFPILEREKKPSIEEFLTWKTKRRLKT